MPTGVAPSSTDAETEIQLISIAVSVYSEILEHSNEKRKERNRRACTSRAVLNHVTKPSPGCRVLSVDDKRCRFTGHCVLHADMVL